MVKVAIIIVVLSLFFGSSSGFMHQNGRVNLHQSRIYMGDTTPLVANGKRFEAEPGSSLMTACVKLGLKVPTDCKKGQCGTCTVTVGGNKMKACVGKVPPAPKLKSLKEKGLAVTVDFK